MKRYRNVHLDTEFQQDEEELDLTEEEDDDELLDLEEDTMDEDLEEIDGLG